MKTTGQGPTCGRRSTSFAVRAAQVETIKEDVPHPTGKLMTTWTGTRLGKDVGAGLSRPQHHGVRGSGDSVCRSSLLGASTGRRGHHLEFVKMQIPGHHPGPAGSETGVWAGARSHLCLKCPRGCREARSPRGRLGPEIPHDLLFSVVLPAGGQQRPSIFLVVMLQVLPRRSNDPSATSVGYSGGGFIVCK